MQRSVVWLSKEQQGMGVQFMTGFFGRMILHYPAWYGMASRSKCWRRSWAGLGGNGKGWRFGFARSHAIELDGKACNA